MDVNIVLEDIRDITSSVADGHTPDLEDLVTLVSQLDTWITRGGNLPQEWVKVRGWHGRCAA